MEHRRSVNGTSSYLEISPPADLAALIACFWEHGPRMAPFTVLPDGCFDFILQHRGGPGAPSAVRAGYLVGPQMRPLHAAAVDGRWSTFGIRFRPGSGFAVLGLPLATLQDRRENLAALGEEVPRGLAMALEDAVGYGAGRAARAAGCAAALRCHFDRTGAAQRLDVVVDNALARLDRSAGALTIRQLATSMGCSTRQLERRFARHAGYSPKQYARLARFRATLRQLRRGMTGADLAAQLGFADQAHMIHEFRAFSSATPSDLSTQRP